MEMKQYQRKAIMDLSRFMDLLNQTQSSAKAYRLFWESKSVPVGYGGVPAYQDILPGVPNLCMKVPTGGGKTFLASCAIRPIFDRLPFTKAKVVVWLVPSDAILTQTLAALRNPDHPYRRRIDTDFGNRVEVYTKQELLMGQNFNITSVTEQLSIMVLSYDSFRGRKEALKAKRENSSLAPMAKALGAPKYPIEDTDETALLQIINQLSPLVIVDESHHARSTLSKEMLVNFNPCFVLDLTATPTKESNILCYVDPVQLKRENMVKLPVVVYNRSSQDEVLSDAIDLRSRLEQYALEEQAVSSVYIRPIVLFQAQPRGKEDSTTFEKLRDSLVSAGIPKEQIAIKTADVDELKNVDLMRPDCSIRYIITVNALKEGWDCPFAYILATLANRTSRVDVEQIVGRVLRQPHTRRHSKPALNMSYVLTSSNDFKTTLDGIVSGLNHAGFSERDYRVGGTTPAPCPPVAQNGTPEPPLPPPDTSVEEPEEFLSFDADALRSAVQSRLEDASREENNGVTAMIASAEKELRDFETAIDSNAGTALEDVPMEVQSNMATFHVNAEFAEEISALRLPQFFKRIDGGMIPGNAVLLQKEHLTEGFTLRGKPYDIDFSRAADELVKVDLGDTEESIPKVFQMSETDQRFIREQFSAFTSEQKIKVCRDIIYNLLNKQDYLSARELHAYIELIVGQMDRDTLSAMERSPQGFALRIKKYVDALVTEHSQKQFQTWLETGRIVCEPSWEFPQQIAPLRSTGVFGGSLYQAEEEVNGFEYKMVMALTGMGNIRWWHRNIANKEFCLNGFIHHYPDFIVMTKNGKVILIETKGDHLENAETRQKLALGRAWQNAAGADYRYYLVFESKDLKIPGAYQLDEFMGMMREM